MTEKTGFARQNSYGIDLTLIEERLKLTPTERIELHQKAFELVQELRKHSQGS